MRFHTQVLKVVFVLALMAVPANCQCRPTSAGTRWGGNQVVGLKEPKPIKSIHGVALDEAMKPMGGVLVEVYDHPEILIQNFAQGTVGKKRLAACMTDETGVFALDVPPGHYELRLSKSSEWDVLSMPVRVRKSAGYSKKGFVLRLQLGT
ncbi:MAG TPA: carboxypeptidase-like regulatory domain-containing protein [Candidatus Acidoferrales bacterium]|nr:carboxypeptidase-like regulatory domain-containing protein [Candidatus Acidoferrales bacterium]